MSEETTNPMDAALSQVHRLGATSLSRRRFLAGSGVAGVAVVATACGSDKKKAKSTSSSTPTTAASGGANDDAKTVAFAAGLEVLAVQTYQAALDAATANKLGAVPPAVAEYVTTAKSHHQAALDKLNGVLTAAGQTAVTAPNAKLKPTVDQEFAKVTDVAGAAKLALMLEDIAAATYLSAIPTLKGKDAITLAGSLNIIDMQHAAVLHFALGEYPVPDVFAKTEKAATP